MEVLGLDIGFGFTKATNGKESLMFKSLIGDAEEIQFMSDFAMSSPTDSLHVTVNGQDYFVGDYAEKQSTVRHYTLEQEKLITDFLQVLALTSIGLLTERYVPLQIVSGLPVMYFREYRDKFKQVLQGHHEVTYHQSDGTEMQRRLNIGKVQLIPQPFGSMLNLILNDRGKVANRDLSRQKVGVVDIGFNTTDYILFDKLHYINRGSKTVKLGVSDCFRQIAEKIRQKSGLSIELYRLYDPVEVGTIKLKGQEYNLEKTREQVYKQTAEVIANEVNQAWADDWDMDAMIITGGGSKELAGYMKPLLNGQIIMPDPGEDVRLRNVQGYLKYARHLWDRGEETVTPDPSQEPAQTPTPPAS